jgi:hypothetical protein
MADAGRDRVARLQVEADTAPERTRLCLQRWPSAGDEVR